MGRRKDWVTRHLVGVGEWIAMTEGREQGAKFMAEHNVPIHVALRVLAKR